MFGPSALAARMEGSKAFSKAFMDRHSIPTARFRVFASKEFGQAADYVKTCGFQVVLKASGLAAGKGVLIPQSTDEAIAGLREIMVNNVFGAAGLHTPPCTYLSHNSRYFYRASQAMRSLLRNSSRDLKYLFSRSPTATPSCHFRRPRIINALEREILGLIPVEWARMLQHLSLPLQLWNAL